MLNVRVMETGEELLIPEVEPIESAQLFKTISDRVWAQRNPDSPLSFTRSLSVISPIEARDQINEAVGEIDEHFLIASDDEAFELGTPYPDAEEVIVTKADLKAPNTAALETYNWDDRRDLRWIDRDGERTAVEFTDGHSDYKRELSAKLWFQKDKAQMSTSYTIHRDQARQGSTTKLYLGLWHSDFAETGYEGHQLVNAEMTEEQELRVLEVMQKMGGIVLDR